jgi:hypothetical protein
MLKSASVSRLETLTITSSIGLTSALFFVTATTTDDALDSALFVVVGLVGLTLALAAASLCFTLLYAISPSSSGEATRRLVAADALNVLLCALRIVLCWSRYVFYDIQVEGIDLALHYTDELLSERSAAIAPHLAQLSSALDIATLLAQLVLSLFKLGIASFLTWLILDLFITRPIARSCAAWRR